MNERSKNTNAKNILYPVFAILMTLIIFVFGFLNSKHFEFLYYLIFLWVFFMVTGFYKYALKIIPLLIILNIVLTIPTYLISRDLAQTYSSLNRTLVLCLSIIPSLSITPIALIRTLAGFKLPRGIVLAVMIVCSFFPLLSQEIKNIKAAMKTRGISFNLKIIYRAFLIPFIVRLVNISDTLSLSVETRGFCVDNRDYTIYKPIKIRGFDFFIVSIFLLSLIIIGVFLWKK